jgi:hypothetical protein
MSTAKREICFTYAILGLFLTSVSALAETASLAARLPKASNAVMTVDVEKLIQSPVGKQLELQSKLMSAYADRPLAVPGTAKRVAIGALVHPGGVQSIWQTALIDLPNPPRLEPVLRAQGGYLDLIGGKQAAWTTRDTFFVALDDHTLGVVRPGQRQLLTRWVSGKLEKGLSPYLTSALNAGANDVCVFAVDLDEVVGVTALKHAVSMGQLPSLAQIETGQDKLLTALASVTGMRLHVRASNRLDGEWIIDFDQDVSALGSQAKPFVIDVLTHADLYEADMDQWEFKAEGKKIVAKRAVELAGLNRVLGLLSPANVSHADATGESSAGGTPAGPGPAPAAAAKDPATASQKYYQAVSKMIDAIGPKPSPKQGATWLATQAKMIQQLPVLNVDPALLEWGNSVASAFTRAAQELAIGQQRAMTAAQGVASPTGYTSYSTSGLGGTDTAETRAAFRNAQQQRQQAAQTERGAAAERAFGFVNDLLGSRGKIRADMTQKYGVEF